MKQYLANVRSEMRHVTWPSRRQVLVSTVVVVAASALTALYLGVLDYVLSIGIEKVI